MKTIADLMELAQQRFARAVADATTRSGLTRIGDDYLKRTDELQRARSVVQAVFPRPALEDRLTVNGRAG